MLNNIGAVELTDEEITANGVSCSCTVATVRLEGKDLLRIARAALARAEADPELEELIYRVLRLTGEGYRSLAEFHSDYLEELEYALGELDEVDPADIPISLVLKTYIDENGEVLGRSAELLSDGKQAAFFSFLAARDGETLGVEAESTVTSSYGWEDSSAAAAIPMKAAC